jgi:hypothetical protein
MAQLQEKQAQQQEALKNAVTNTVFAPPKKVVAEDTEIYEMSFTVKATKNKLKALKEFLIEGGYTFQ